MNHMGLEDDIYAELETSPGIDRVEYLVALQRAANERLDNLRARPARSAYVDEINGLQAAVDQLAERILALTSDAREQVVPFSLPERKRRIWNPTATLLVGTLAGQKRNLRPFTVPAIEVRRAGQLVVRCNGRARVADRYVLMIGPREALSGTKRAMLRQATGAAMMDPLGMWPAIHMLRGRARQRAFFARRQLRRNRRLEKNMRPDLVGWRRAVHLAGGRIRGPWFKRPHGGRG